MKVKALQFYINYSIVKSNSCTVTAVYSELDLSEYPVVLNGFLRTDCQFIVKLNTLIVNTGF